MLVFWFLVRNNVVLAVYLLFLVSCFFTVHEHWHKVHNLSTHRTGGSHLISIVALPVYQVSVKKCP